MVSNLQYGDTVSLSRAQASRVTVLNAPGPGGEDYSVTLPINEEPKTFTYSGEAGETLNDVAYGLENVLLAEQTVYSVAVDGVSPWRLAIVGLLGETFEVGVSSNLQAELLIEAVSATNSRTGEQIGPGRITEADDSLRRLRHFSTRDAEGDAEVREVHQVQFRELGTGNRFEVDGDEVLTLIEEG
jgi:hypothetical protein